MKTAQIKHHEKPEILPLGAIPLHQLFAGKSNPRNGHAQDALEELKASILAHGVLSSLVVTADGPDGGYTVVAGSRRLAALQQLAAEGKIASDHPVPCVLFHGKAEDAEEVALAENVVRLDMHPVDQFRAFAALTDKNIPPADIAARFGVSERIVRQRLALGKASSVLLDAYRDGKLTLDKLAAYCVTEDQKAQEEFYNSGQGYHPQAIRAALLQKPVTARDYRVRFVTLEAYEAAGGKTSRDLFLDDENGIYIQNTALLTKLVKDKLEAAAEELRADGWNTVKFLPDDFDSFYTTAGHKLKDGLTGATVKTREPTAEETAEMEKITTRFDAILKENGAEDELDLKGAAEEEFEKLQKRYMEIEEGLEDFPAAVKKSGTAFIGIDKYSGALDRHFFKPAKPDKKTAEKKAAASVTGDKTDDSAAISDKLFGDLCWHRSAAIAAELADAPYLALRLVTHKMAAETLYGHRNRWESPLHIDADQFCAQRNDLFHRDAAGSVKGWNKLLQDKTIWLDQTPEKLEDLWGWMQDQDNETILDILAFCTACTLQIRHTVPLDAIDADLAATLGVNMAQYFTPDADNLFSRLTKPQLLAALKDMRNTPATADEEKMSKAALVELAARSAKKHADWLPAPLRLKTAETPSPLLKTEGAGEGKDEGAKTKKEKPLDLAERGAVKKTGDKKKPAAKKGKKS